MALLAGAAAEADVAGAVEGAEVDMTQDRVGLGWRSELGPSILMNRDQIDVVEVIVDDYLSASKLKLRSLKTLAAQIPVLYHGVGLGLASSIPISQHRLDRLARTLDHLQVETWSEHLSFVRAGGHEIGHLAAPPRTDATIEGALHNLKNIQKTLGSIPVLENIATLVEPPGSRMSEPQWIQEILDHSNSPLLLDLHNLYSNAVNFGHDPATFLKAFPLNRVQIVHLSGGHWIQEPLEFQSKPDQKRLLDDHVHDVPEEVFHLLKILAKSTSQPLTVILERDGQYPDFQILLQQIRKAREILREARTHRREITYERPIL